MQHGTTHLTKAPDDTGAMKDFDTLTAINDTAGHTDDLLTATGAG